MFAHRRRRFLVCEQRVQLLQIIVLNLCVHAESEVSVGLPLVRDTAVFVLKTIFAISVRFFWFRPVD